MENVAYDLYHYTKQLVAFSKEQERYGGECIPFAEQLCWVQHRSEKGMDYYLDELLEEKEEAETVERTIQFVLFSTSPAIQEI
jgi:hypothetical protein